MPHVVQNESGSFAGGVRERTLTKRGLLVSEWRVRMNILLWVLQVLLALAFFAHGCLFLFPPAAMVEQMNATLPRWFQLFLGVAEVLAAVGLTLPGFTRIQPWLISCAATGIMI